MDFDGKFIVICAPSGSGKSTLVQHVVQVFPEIDFSVSATSRAPRGSEKHGVEYYFISSEEFEKKIAENAFLEWEQVYNGTYYGTLNVEIERLWKTGKHVALDIDVEGGIYIKSHFPKKTLAIYIDVPSMEELRRRLVARGTDSEDKIDERVAKAEFEKTRAHLFDHVVVNDDLEKAKDAVVTLVRDFIN